MASLNGKDIERPNKKARSGDARKENTANEGETNAKKKVCRFCISSVESKGKYGKDFFVSLLEENQGLYHLVDAVFRHELSDLSGGDAIDSHLWKIQFGDFANLTYDSVELLRDFGSIVCDAVNPRLFHTFEPKKGMTGWFRGESGEFKFEVNQVCDAELGQSYPKFQDIPAPVLTASSDSTYISGEEKRQAMVRRKKFVTYYAGKNDWKEDYAKWDVKDCFIPCKPLPPAWGHRENTVIGLFLKGGWKFKMSWAHGLQYALLHRAETATSGRWYQLKVHKNYLIQHVGQGMTQEQMIIQAKKLCKDMMEATLAKEAPKKRPKPKTRSYRRDHHCTFEF